MNGILVFFGASLFLLGFWAGYGWKRTAPRKGMTIAIGHLEPGKRVAIPVRWEETE